MEKDKNLLENDQLYKTLFEYSNEKENDLYKNDLFTPSIEDEELPQENNSKIRTEIIRDKILKKLSLEDYNLFPPKNDSFLINDNEVGKDKEQEKIYEETIDHLQNLHKMNYLTFSPFGMSFCPDLNSIKRKNSNNEYDREETIEKENKILNIIDFNYNNYEINNDLLFNISMGFIDMNKLKLENVDKPKNNDNLKQDKSISNKDLEVELKTDLMNKLEKFVKAHEKIEFFSSCIHQFHKDLNELKNMNENSEKNKILFKWEKILTEKNKLYQKDLAEQKEKEREKKRKEEKLQKEMEEQRLIKIQKEKKFEAELEKIRKKASKKVEKDRRSLLYLGSNRISQDLNFSKDIFSSPTIKSFYSKKSFSPNPFRLKNINKQSSRKISNNIKTINKKRRESMISDNSKFNLGFQKSCKSFNFKAK
jgi:hypothetical protein